MIHFVATPPGNINCLIVQTCHVAFSRMKSKMQPLIELSSGFGFVVVRRIVEEEISLGSVPSKDSSSFTSNISLMHVNASWAQYQLRQNQRKFQVRFCWNLCVWRMCESDFVFMRWECGAEKDADVFSGKSGCFTGLSLIWSISKLKYLFHACTFFYFRKNQKFLINSLLARFLFL